MFKWNDIIVDSNPEVKYQREIQAQFTKDYKEKKDNRKVEMERQAKEIEIREERYRKREEDRKKVEERKKKIDKEFGFVPMLGQVQKDYDVNIELVKKLSSILQTKYCSNYHMGYLDKEEVLYALSAIYAGYDTKHVSSELNLMTAILKYKKAVKKDSFYDKRSEYDKNSLCKQLREDPDLFLRCLQVIFFLDKEAYTSMCITRDNLENVLKGILRYVAREEIEVRYNTRRVLSNVEGENDYVFVCFSQGAKKYFERLNDTKLEVYKEGQGFAKNLPEIDIAFLNYISLFDIKLITSIYKYCDFNLDKLFNYVTLSLKENDIAFYYGCGYWENYISCQFMYKHKLFKYVLDNSLQLLNKDKTIPYGEHETISSNIQAGKVNLENPVKLALLENYIGVNSFVIDYLVNYELEYSLTTYSCIKQAIKDYVYESRFRVVKEGTGYFPYMLVGYYECDNLYEKGLTGNIETRVRRFCDVKGIELGELQKNSIKLLARILNEDESLVEKAYRKCNFNSVQTFDCLFNGQYEEEQEETLTVDEESKDKILASITACNKHISNNDKEKLTSELNTLTYLTCLYKLPVSEELESISNNLRTIEDLSSLNIHQTFDEIGGLIYGDISNASTLYGMEKLRARQGHGFAAERANHFIDKVKCERVQILGDDNAKNGADRMVNGVCMQSKYCATPRRCVSACFKGGSYRYYNVDGSPMVIEVPKGMGTEAIKVLELRIAKGEVKGVSDVSKAKDLVREGNVTYTQAKNLAKAGNIDSLVFDSTNGMVIAGNAMGVSATVAFATALWNGEDFDIALKNAIFTGIKVGGVTFITSVISSQLTKVGLNSLLVGTTDSLIKMIGPKASATLVNSFRTGSNIYGASAMTSASKLLRGNIITGAVTILVLSTGDIFDMFGGRISRGQLIKNVTNTAGSVVGGTAGAVGGAALGASIGTIIPGAGTIIGGAIGGIIGSLTVGTASSVVVSSITDVLIEDDAVYLLEIIQDEFKEVALDYMLTKNEAERLVKILGDSLTPQTLKDMFASNDRYKFANELLVPECKKLCCERKHIYMPDDESIVEDVKIILESISD